MADEIARAAREERRAAIAVMTGHLMQDDDLLTQALTHASSLGANLPAESKRALANERLEFLGDALLGAALCEWFYERYPQLDEGGLSRLKSRLGSRMLLAEVCDAVGLLTWCKTANLPGGIPVSVRANLVEGLLAAIYLEGGWPALCRAVRRLFEAHMELPPPAEPDPRLALQSWCLEHHRRLPDYLCERCGGTDHAPEFLAQVSINGQSSSGTGTSRRRAEAAAASALLVLIADAGDIAT